jgi:hypothetical protein
LSKKEGGFGVKDLHQQNRCLLLNFIHKLHQLDSFRNSACDLGATSSSPSFLERIVAECLPLYRSITRVEVAGGISTSFWFDKWLPERPLSERFPSLLSHCTRLHATIAMVSAHGLEL